jgi:hypothetical protein
MKLSASTLKATPVFCGTIGYPSLVSNNTSIVWPSRSIETTG